MDLYDQSGKKMPGIINGKLVSSKNEEKEFQIKSEEVNHVTLETNSVPGKWKIIASHEGISEEKELVVNEIKKVSFDFLDSILIIKNVGNATI